MKPNYILMQSFEFLDLILFLGISQGVFLAITIQMLKHKNKSANRMLSVILLVAVVMLLGRMIYFRFLTPTMFRWTILIDGVIFIFGPLCYTYLRRLAFSNNDHYKLSWYHYLPAMFHICFFIYSMSFSISVYSEKVSAGVFTIPFFCIEGGGILSNFYYWYLSIQLIRTYTREEKNRVSFKQNLVSFLTFFQISVGVFLMTWLISFIAGNFFKYSFYPIGYDTLWGGISIFIFVIGYYSLKEPELFRVPLYADKPKPTQQRLPEQEIVAIEKGLRHIIEEEKIFLKMNLTLRDLSERLDTSTHNISWYLNQVSKSSFYDYINHYRIKEFLKKIENNEHIHHTILALSMDVGFNSKSTFNKAFKLEMNDTPSNYIKRLKVA
ncbi:AraC family transcriptional regulator [Aquimarina sp. AU474]|uniref:helix-turn-helix domain-containing protein n=1 Tax=Aquimarina sp. AU474 TaxID=2108529 RepID=UPI000D68E786|nr:AraC family transcriptional regulator [Aquimarina sp. AU474]